MEKILRINNISWSIYFVSILFFYFYFFLANEGVKSSFTIYYSFGCIDNYREEFNGYCLKKLI